MLRCRFSPESNPGAVRSGPDNRSIGALRRTRPASTVRVSGGLRRTPMTTALRPLRIRLVDPTQVGDLLAYLRERSCVAEQVDAVAIDVWPPPLLHENGNGNGNGQGSLACAACGERVEAALQRLGSPRCHDCRGRLYA